MRAGEGGEVEVERQSLLSSLVSPFSIPFLCLLSLVARSYRSRSPARPGHEYGGSGTFCRQGGWSFSGAERRESESNVCVFLVPLSLLTSNRKRKNKKRKKTSIRKSNEVSLLRHLQLFLLVDIEK